MNTGYGLRGLPDQWQSNPVLFHTSVGDATERSRDFGSGDAVVPDVRVETENLLCGTQAFSTAVQFGLHRRAWYRRWAAAAVVIVVSFILLLAPPSAHAANQSKEFDAEVARKYAGVAGWQGFWESTLTRSFSKSNVMGYTQKAYEGVSHGRFELTRGRNGWAPERGDFEWTGSGEAAGRTSDTESSWQRAGTRMTGYDWQISGGGHGASSDVSFTLWMGRRYASLHAGSGTEDVAATHKVGHGVRYLGSPHGQAQYKEEAYNETWSAPIQQFFIPNYEKDTKNWVVAQGGPGVLVFEHEEKHHVSIGGLRRSRVVMVPVYDDLEVEVTIAGYAEWRPQGSIADPSKPGNALAARAVLKSKSGKPTDLPEVERFRFELIDTSREPGVCMNWPLAAKDENFDLEFADLTSGNPTEQVAAVRKFFAEWGMTSSGDYDPASMPAGGIPRLSFAEVAEDGQRAELTEPPQDEAGRPFAEAAIECFDFGAKAELRVTCILKDGRELLGLMKGEDGEQDLVRLPKRAGPDWIAENWRKKHDVMNLAANDDNEKVDGQPHNGDGFTLYEEYRGWVQQGKHLEGDPRRKDFFVLNQRGADFRGGIALFGRLSKLRVHSTVREGKEMSGDVRCMNLNRRDAPHRVDQHGVILARDNGGGGGLTVGVEGANPARSFRPRYVAQIFLEWSEAGRGVGVFSVADGKKYGLSLRDAELAWDRGVAHELLHAVGVEHHGEQPHHTVKFNFQGATSPLNPTRRPRYVGEFNMWAGWYVTHADDTLTEDMGPTLTLKWEDTGRDVFEDGLAAYEQKLEAYRASSRGDANQEYWNETIPKLSRFGKGREFWQEHDASASAARDLFQAVHVGVKNGTDSGNELCVMRYYFADGYEVDGQSNAYYLMRPGTSRAGRDICRSPAGTGTNASGHQPQSRFGDAHSGRGNCFGQICPNDAIPPR